jgi:hypothetical protein
VGFSKTDELVGHHRAMTSWVDVERMLARHERVRRSGDRWTLGGRLVARRVDEYTLLVRSGFAERERLVEEHPDTFHVTPPLEAHMKVLARIPEGDADAIESALAAAVALQGRV